MDHLEPSRWRLQVACLSARPTSSANTENVPSVQLSSCFLLLSSSSLFSGVFLVESRRRSNKTLPNKNAKLQAFVQAMGRIFMLMRVTLIVNCILTKTYTGIYSTRRNTVLSWSVVALQLLKESVIALGIPMLLQEERRINQSGDAVGGCVCFPHSLCWMQPSERLRPSTKERENSNTTELAAHHTEKPE